MRFCKSLKSTREANLLLIVCCLILFFCTIALLFLYSNTPNENELEAYSGAPYNIKIYERKGKYKPGHIEFMIDQQLFYYSGPQYRLFKNALLKEIKYLYVGAADNHGRNNNFMVVYKATSKDGTIVTFKKTHSKDLFTIYLWLVIFIFGLFGIYFAIKEKMRLKVDNS